MKENSLTGGLRSHSSQGTLIWGSEAKALCVRRPPHRTPTPPPTETAPPRFPRPPASQKKKGILCALPQYAVGVLARAPRGKEGEVSPGSVLCREGREAARSFPEAQERFCLRRPGLSPRDLGSFRAFFRAEHRRPNPSPPTRRS